MEFYVIESHSLVIGWSPKCACTAVTDWIVHGILKPATPIKKEREYLALNGFVKSPEQVYDLILTKGFKAIIFTRNPMMRIASAFIDKFICRSGNPLYYPDNFEEFAIRFVEQLYEYNNYDNDYQGISFVDFLNYIENCLGEQKKLNHHWAPQTTNLTDDLKYLIFSRRCFIVKQEAFEHDLKNINFALGFDYLPRRRNVSKWPVAWAGAPRSKDYSAITNKEIVEGKTKIAKDNLLTNNAKLIIARIYHDDFKLFSYPLKYKIKTL